MQIISPHFHSHYSNRFKIKYKNVWIFARIQEFKIQEKNMRVTQDAHVVHVLIGAIILDAAIFPPVLFDWHRLDTVHLHISSISSFCWSFWQFLTFWSLKWTTLIMKIGNWWPFGEWSFELIRINKHFLDQGTFPLPRLPPAGFCQKRGNDPSL